MDELKRCVATNLVQLRMTKGWTQAELAEQIHYSDKAVSKWERGESLPDVAVLKSLAGLYGVTVDYLLEPHEGESVSLPEREESRVDTRMIILVALVGIWTVALLIYVIFWMMDRQIWLIGVAAMPATLVALLVFNSLWNKGRFNMWIVAALVASLFLLIYCCFMPYNPWQMFLVAIPAELLVFLSFHIVKKKRKP